MADIEKVAVAAPSPSPNLIEVAPVATSWLARLSAWEERCGIEQRGVARVPPDARTKPSWVSVFTLWFSTNLTTNNLLIGCLGPIVFGLSFADTVALSVCGSFFGAFGPAYISGLGPLSGSRTLVVGRFAFGWYCTKVCALLQLCATLGYGLVDALITGQILDAVSGGQMGVTVGVIVAGIIAAVVCGVGIRGFKIYERWAWMPQMAVLFVLIGISGPRWVERAEGVQLAGDIGKRMSYFWLAFSNTWSWSICAADYFVYYPESTSRVKVGAATHAGLFLSVMFVEIVGAGLASTLSPDDTTTTGSILVGALAPLGGFGSFCAVILALGPITNTIPGVYSSAMAWQVLGRKAKWIPRFGWTLFSVTLYTVCAIAGRNSLYDIFQNMLALLGYWSVILVLIIGMEEFIFRRQTWWRKRMPLDRPDEGDDDIWNWSLWDDPKRLPIGLAGSVSFLIGWAGAIIGMYQVWWVGPIAELALGDVGMPLAATWAALVFPTLRFLELRWIGR